MANNPKNPFEKQLNSGAKFKSDLLSDISKERWPDRIDYVAGRITKEDYAIGLDSKSPAYLSDGQDLDKAAAKYYLRGIAALTGDKSRVNSLPGNFRLGDLLVDFAELQNGLEHVDRHDVPAGEIISRLITRTTQRQSSGQEAQLAQQLRADAETPRELVSELTTVPELAPVVESALPDSDDPSTLTTELASLDLTTELWEHQLESLALWLHHDMNAYVDMATATGKTVLGLAAVAHAVDSGSLHPGDQQRLEDIFDGDLPDPHQNRPNDVLIVTTDDLLGVQWARLFQEHCHTPPAFTKLDDTGIKLPWGRIHIRSAGGMGNIDPSDYRLAIFDEVHNYSGRSGWGDHLTDFIESSCPVLALTGSVTDELESLVSQVDRTFPLVYRYTHRLALADGVIPDFEWKLSFSTVSDTDTLTQFRDTATQFNQIIDYDGGTYRLNPDTLSEAAPDLGDDEITKAAGEYVSGSALAKGLREIGDDATAPTESLEAFASGMSNRTIHRLNLSADLEPIISAAKAALMAERPVLVLTRSYKEAKEIWQALYDPDDNSVVKRLEASQSAAEHDSTITSFDDAETDQKALIGPGKRLGKGNDIQSVEVGINIARSGSGVNATLVQRLGRLLRDAGGKDTVEFYHVIGIPPADAVIQPDGESFVRTVAEFFGQVLEPNTDGILKPPTVTIEDVVRSDIDTLEQYGAPSILSHDHSTVIETAYATEISEQSNSGSPVVATDWFSDAFGDETQYPVGDDSEDDQDRAAPDEDTEDKKGTTETDDDPIETDDDPNKVDTTDSGSQTEDTPQKEVVDGVSPLAEHYDAFRSLGIIHKALHESIESDISKSDPSKRWINDIRSIITAEGFGDQEIGYGKQMATQSLVEISEYRSEHGTGNRVTDYEIVSVDEPSEAVMALLNDELSGLSSWAIPVSPTSGVQLPVIVESEAELERARALLSEFPDEPPVYADESSAPNNDT